MSLEGIRGHHPHPMFDGPCRVEPHMTLTGAPLSEKPGVRVSRETTLVETLVKEAEAAEECLEEQFRGQPRSEERRGRGT